MSEREDHTLLMPFVVCLTQGGTYDDDAYVAGYECGIIDATLGQSQPVMTERYVHSANMPQLDLIAMRHGYTTQAEPWDEDESWTHVLLSKVAQQETGQ